MNWIFCEGKGIKNLEKEIEIFFNSSRSDIRELLNYDPQKNKGRNEKQDHYRSCLNTDFNLRLHFKSDLLKEIEILNGTIKAFDIPITIGSDLRQIIVDVESLGYKYLKGSYSYTFPKIKVDIGDSEENGGDENQVCWFYTAENIDHLIKQ